MSKLLFTTSSFNLNHFHDRHVIEEAGFEFVFNTKGRRLTELEILDMMDDQVVGMVAGTEPLTCAVFEKAQSLKVISRCGIGLDSVDLQAAKSCGIKVYNTPDAPTSAVAELTVGHILSLVRSITASDRLIRAGQWKPIMGRLLEKQTVGIVGFGRIGRKVANLLEAFGANILVYEKTPPLSSNQINFVAFEELLKQSDIVTLHLPYEASTHHIMNEDAIALMKSTALLVNVSRGGLIDEDALLSAINVNRLAGAALDCFEEEPYKGPLLACDKVQITAHMGSYAHETRAIMEAEACSSLVQGLREYGLLQCEVLQG